MREHDDPHVPELGRNPRYSGGDRQIGFYCRVCQKSTPARRDGRVPLGWYMLNRAGDSAAGQRLGLYCSARCLLVGVERVRGIEDHLGEDWQQRVDPRK